jgi:hypothetical protein
MKFRALLAAALLCLSLAACTKQDAQQTVENFGLTDVQLTGYRWFGCGKDDTYHTGFIAKRGDRVVTGVVCEGLMFKGATVRFD